MTIYIAGKISGDRDYKEKFNQYQEALEDCGYTVLSPAVLPSSGFSYEAYIRMSAAMLRECEAVCFLPDWEYSNGAIQEFETAVKEKKAIYFVKDSETDESNKSLHLVSETSIAYHMKCLPIYKRNIADREREVRDFQLTYLKTHMLIESAEKYASYEEMSTGYKSLWIEMIINAAIYGGGTIVLDVPVLTSPGRTRSPRDIFADVAQIVKSIMAQGGDLID